jgi:hypothetical protein
VTAPPDPLAQAGSVRIEHFSAVPEPDGATQVRLRWVVRGAEHVVLSGRGRVPHAQRRGIVLEIESATTYVLTAYGRGLSEIATCRRSLAGPRRPPSRPTLIGAIALWSGEPASVPPGWRLCDGSHGTPNLIDRFVLGAGADAHVGDQGDGDSHRHRVALTLTGSTREAADHRHSLAEGWAATDKAAAPGGDLRGIADAAGLSAGGRHTHQVRIELTPNTVDQRPPEVARYALCFIVWTGEA